jgi:hypothetical protein
MQLLTRANYNYEPGSVQRLSDLQDDIAVENYEKRINYRPRLYRSEVHS